ncbi:Pyruvate/Phosphoenolpyruvate kinase-like domain-containing protein [Ochromonadaceae sp. CCMP2298]|nr:Pyruvate/Phosphoenolpyruvate kinase-like domain-containing protein [Ochromonadaceae sp. CCMP2298]
MIQMAVKRAKRANPKVKVGVCGEHGGDPSSVHFFDQIGVDYVSCSPYRIPIAKVAAAQAHIKQCSAHPPHHSPHLLLSHPFLLPMPMPPFSAQVRVGSLVIPLWHLPSAYF